MKDYKRHIIEFLLVFLSVFAAFLFENYRVELEEESNYLNSLRDFQTDLQKNIANFEFENDKVATKLRGYRYMFQEDLGSLISLSISNRFDEYMARTLIYFKLQQVTPVEWIFPSVQYSNLMSDYFHHIKNTEFKIFLPQYRRRFTQREATRASEIEAWKNINDLIDEHYDVIRKDSEFYNFQVPDSTRYDQKQAAFKYLFSNSNRAQFTKDYNRFTNLIYTLKRINELSIYNNTKKIEVFMKIDSLINLELNQW